MVIFLACMNICSKQEELIHLNMNFMNRQWELLCEKKENSKKAFIRSILKQRNIGRTENKKFKVIRICFLPLSKEQNEITISIFSESNSILPFACLYQLYNIFLISCLLSMYALIWIRIKYMYEEDIHWMRERSR